MTAKRSGPPRCKDCRGPIKWLTMGGRWLPFNPIPVDPRHHAGAPAFPVEEHTAYRLDELIVELQGRRELSFDEARDEAYDMPWYVKHICPPVTDPDLAADFEPDREDLS